MTPDYWRLSPREAWQTSLQTLIHLGFQNLHTADLQMVDANNWVSSDNSQLVQNYVSGPDNVHPACLRDVVSCLF